MNLVEHAGRWCAVPWRAAAIGRLALVAAAVVAGSTVGTRKPVAALVGLEDEE